VYVARGKQSHPPRWYQFSTIKHHSVFFFLFVLQYYPSTLVGRKSWCDRRLGPAKKKHPQMGGYGLFKSPLEVNDIADPLPETGDGRGWHDVVDLQCSRQRSFSFSRLIMTLTFKSHFKLWRRLQHPPPPALIKGWALLGPGSSELEPWSCPPLVPLVAEPLCQSAFVADAEEPGEFSYGSSDSVTVRKLLDIA